MGESGIRQALKKRYPAERVIVELDGWSFNSDRESFESDRVKDAVALELGIETIRLTRRRIRQSPRREADRVLAILARRRKTLMGL